MEFRLETAKKLEADHVVQLNPKDTKDVNVQKIIATSGRPDVIIEASGAPDSLSLAISVIINSNVCLKVLSNLRSANCSRFLNAVGVSW